MAKAPKRASRSKPVVPSAKPRAAGGAKTAAPLSIKLPVRLRKFVEDEISAGRFRSTDEAVAQGLMLLEREQRVVEAWLQDARSKIAEGLRELDQGKGLDGDAVFAALIRDIPGARSRPRRKAG